MVAPERAQPELALGADVEETGPDRDRDAEAEQYEGVRAVEHVAEGRA